MCKLIVGVTKEIGNTEFIKTIKAQYEDLTERDGLSAVVITQDKLYTFRELNDYDAIFERITHLLPKAKAVSLHSRQGTGGTICTANIHFFERNGYLLAHNGTIPKLSPYQNFKMKWDTKDNAYVETNEEEEICNDCLESPEFMCDAHNPQLSKSLIVVPKKFKPCDTLQFLHKLTLPATVTSFKAEADEYNANGMFVLINKKTKEIMLHIDKKVHAITDKKKFSVYTSFTPTEELKQDTWFYAFGTPIYDKKSSIKLAYKPREVSYGTFILEY